ncbi:hypothetical protein LTR10_007608 [Elasticomyces elasticus]|nr:hypothetical protein LTR10_007608 [Elasticomyces elasticus]KAK4970612.1 hypothetical protein LTR42_007587 [Elasticomyces elasticus]
MANLAPMSEAPGDTSTSAVAPILQAIDAITKVASMALLNFPILWTLSFTMVREGSAQRARRLRELPHLPPTDPGLLRTHTELITGVAKIKRAGEGYVSLRSKLGKEFQGRLGPGLDQCSMAKLSLSELEDVRNGTKVDLNRRSVVQRSYLTAAMGSVMTSSFGCMCSLLVDGPDASLLAVLAREFQVFFVITIIVWLPGYLVAALRKVMWSWRSAK